MNFFDKLFQRKPVVDLDELNRNLAPKLEKIRRPAVSLCKTVEKRNSKFGGQPIANSSVFEWPRDNGKPLAFLGQLDLAEIAKVYQYDWLGDRGSLLFFYDVVEMPWGFDPKDKGKWRVIFQAEPNNTISYPEDLSTESRLSEIYISPKLVQILPNFDDPAVEALCLSDDEVDAYIDWDDGISGSRHQVGGYPKPVQGNHMELKSQLASNGIYLGGVEGYKSDAAKKLESGARDWKLLFQFDSDDDLGVMWGDCGKIYFWVQEQKAKQNDFESCWLVLQCG